LSKNKLANQKRTPICQDENELKLLIMRFPFSALTLLVGRREGHPVCNSLDVGLLVETIWLELCTTYGSNCHHHFHHC